MTAAERHTIRVARDADTRQRTVRVAKVRGPEREARSIQRARSVARRCRVYEACPSDSPVTQADQSRAVLRLLKKAPPAVRNRNANIVAADKMCDDLHPACPSCGDLVYDAPFCPECGPVRGRL